MSAWSLNETDLAPFVSATKLYLISNRDKWLTVVATSVYSLIGFPIKRDLRLPIDFDAAIADDARPSMSMNLFTFDWKAQGAVAWEGEVSSSRDSRRGEQSAIVISYLSRSRLVKRLDTGLENVNRSSTVRLDRLTVELDCGPFLLGMDRWAGWSTLGERWDHLTSRGQGHGYSLSVVSKVSARSANATYEESFLNQNDLPPFSNCFCTNI